MVKIIAFEGSDYSGKTSTLDVLAQEFKNEDKYCFNKGAIYPGKLSVKLSSVSQGCSSSEREFLYTMGYVLDSIESTVNNQQDDRMFFQDRYWASVVSYGRFLNGDQSIHNKKDFIPMFIIPVATIYLTCSYQEKINRSNLRNSRSSIDNYLLNDLSKLIKLEQEIDRSLEGLPYVFKIDTTDKSIEKVASEIKTYLYDNKIF